MLCLFKFHRPVGRQSEATTGECSESYPSTGNSGDAVAYCPHKAATRTNKQTKQRNKETKKQRSILRKQENKGRKKQNTDVIRAVLCCTVQSRKLDPPSPQTTNKQINKPTAF